MHPVGMPSSMVALVLRASCVYRTGVFLCQMRVETGSEHEHRFWLQCFSHCLDCVLLKEDLDELAGVGYGPHVQQEASCRICSSVSLCTPLLLLVATSVSGACLLELLHHLVLQDCTTYPVHALILIGPSRLTLAVCPGCLTAIPNAQAFREIKPKRGTHSFGLCQQRKADELPFVFGPPTVTWSMC